MSPVKVAVVGAGVAGLTCAQTLRAAGVEVSVFEKSRGPGGRATTRRTQLGEPPAHTPFGLDQGPVCFTATTEDFQEAVHRWAQWGVVAEWPAASAALGSTAWVGVPGMNALGRHLAQGVPVQANQRVTQLVRQFTPGQAHPRWRLVWRDDSLAEHQTDLFDAVVVATPAEQVVSLLAAFSDAAPLAAHVHSEACWAVMLAFDLTQGASGLKQDWLTLDERTGFAVAVRDSAKPGRETHLGPGDVAVERWVMHATPAWSQQHLNDAPEAVIAHALAALAARHPPVFQAAHRWRYSQPVNPIRLSHVWQPQRRLGACGDWLGNANWQGLERAWASGRALAQAMQAMLTP
jgi:predicted NAD/FAD-dependent oxidoreductase